MGKLRDHIPREDHGLAEWIKRKLVNHDPLSQRNKASGLASPKGRRVVHTDHTAVVHYRANGGRTFRIEVAEITGDSETLLIDQQAMED
jgi:hypothetical protein